MRTNKIDAALRALTGAALLAAMLAGCAKPAPPPAPAETVAPAIPDVPPAEVPAPDAAPAAPAQPAPEAPPPTEPSAAPKPTAAAEPDFDDMKVATPSAKMGVAVDLRYSFDTEVLPNQTATLNLAAVPRVDGAHVKVSVKEVAGVQLAAGPQRLQKVNGSDVYRRQFSVTPGADAPTELRVLVTMDMEAGSGFGFYSIPLTGGITAQKQDSVKQR